MSRAEGGSPTPYIPNTDADRAAMLAAIGVSSVDELFADLPERFRDPAIALPPALAEGELMRFMQCRAAENRVSWDTPAFLGAGAYRHLIPAIVPQLMSRSEFVTAYTPYQPEISQGTLQAAFEYQSVVCELTGMDISNTGLYDVGSATAEACLLAARITKRRAVAVLEPVHPGTLDVIRTYCFGGDIRVDTVLAMTDVTEEHACLVAQQPDFLGGIRDVEPVAEAAHGVGALCIVVADPFALGMLRAPGDAGADLVTGEGRDLAGGTNFGGPSLGIFAAKQQLMRQMPGRIVGRTKELHGPRLQDGSRGEPRTGYVLTLQAREQFIRRERATSNFSTGQSLIALGFTIAVQALGPLGLREAAELAYQKSHDAASRIAALPGVEVVAREPWFCEFLVSGPVRAPELAARLRERGIVPGLDVSQRPEHAAWDSLLFCITDATPDDHVDRLIQALTAIGAGE
ncbi:MAG TPA: aminomethyl-transferring glycine dehydrogenase subunit GcvPA [Tepidiformaceae bacterium]|nr:aminomethyl-transferring glycine dehydrogenase subunit GcvPA [Tepidiformaceae bacterium]